MSKITQFQAYRLAIGADPDMPLSEALRGQLLLETRPFTGLELRCTYASGGGAISPGYTLQMWVYDRAREKFFLDKTQVITVTEEGDDMHHLTTNGQTVLLRVDDLVGNQPTLEIQTAFSMDAKV